MIESLPIASFSTPAVVVSRSTACGFSWDNPVSVGGNVSSSDKSWIVCDNTSTSPFYGNCYVEWDNPFTGDGILMSTSTDGGLTWGAAAPTANRATGIGGQPPAQPNRTDFVSNENNRISGLTSPNGRANLARSGAVWGRSNDL